MNIQKTLLSALFASLAFTSNSANAVACSVSKDKLSCTTADVYVAKAKRLQITALTGGGIVGGIGVFDRSKPDVAYKSYSVDYRGIGRITPVYIPRPAANKTYFAKLRSNVWGGGIPGLGSDCSGDRCNGYVFIGAI